MLDATGGFYCQISVSQSTSDGTRSVNPKATTRVVRVHKWFNPVKEREAATTPLGQVIDVLTPNTKPAAFVQIAQEEDV